MILKYSSYNPTKEVSQPTQSTQQGGWEDILPGAGGLVGSLVQPEGLLPGAITGGIGGALGETGRQAVRSTQGKTFDPMQILKSGGEQAAYSAIPGGQEMKALPVVGRIAENVLGRVGLRAGTGFLGGAGAQAIANVGSQSPQNPLTAGAMTGALNAVIPGVTGVLGLGTKGISQLGKTAIGSSQRILERRTQPELAAIQHLFGREAVSTAEGKAVVNPVIKKIIDKYNIPIPPKGDISAFKPAIDKASAAVEKELQPILKDPIYSIQSAIPKSLITDNLGQFFGREFKRASRLIPLKVDKLFKDGVDEAGNINLSTLKEVQRQIGPVGGENWSQSATTPIEKWARKTYGDLGKMIDDKLETVDKAQYKDLINQHRILIKARDAYRGVTGGKGTLPVELTSQELAQEKAQGGLSGERLRELGIRSLPLIAGAGAQLIPGVPKPIKEAATLGAGLYGAAAFGPHINPEKALQIGEALKNIPSANSAQIQRILQQLGVRLPGLGQ